MKQSRGKQLVARRMVDFLSVFAGYDERLPQPLVDFLMETSEHPALDYVVDSFALAAEAGLDVCEPEMAQRLVDAGKERLRRANQPQPDRFDPPVNWSAVSKNIREKRDQGSVVYFMRVGNRVKIGYTYNLKQRLASFNPEELMAVERGAQGRERELHLQFDSYRVHGEWFRLEGAVADYISTLQEVRRDREAAG